MRGSWSCSSSGSFTVKYWQHFQPPVFTWTISTNKVLFFMAGFIMYHWGLGCFECEEFYFTHLLNRKLVCISNSNIPSRTDTHTHIQYIYIHCNNIVSLTNQILKWHQAWPSSWSAVTLIWMIWLDAVLDLPNCTMRLTWTFSAWSDCRLMP